MALSPGVRYMAYSPSPSAAAAPHSPHIHGVRSSSAALSEQEKYLNVLLAECPFTAILPICYRPLSQEILCVTALLENASVLGQSGLDHASPLTSGGIVSNEGADFNGWLAIKIPIRKTFISTTTIAKLAEYSGQLIRIHREKTIRLDSPVDQYPNYNFVGRILGPRGNFLKRVKASTDCRVLVRGHGSIKDPAREEMMRGEPDLNT